MKEISYAKGHNDNCRKGFFELADEPGNEDLNNRLNKSFERATRKFLAAEGQDEPHMSDARIKTQDTRNRSTQTNVEERAEEKKDQSESTGMKRAMSKTMPNGSNGFNEEIAQYNCFFFRAIWNKNQK